MMHRDDAVVLRRIAIPSRAVVKIGPQERRNLANSILDSGCRQDPSYHHVAFRMESLPILAFNPLSDWQPRNPARLVPSVRILRSRRADRIIPVTTSIATYPATPCLGSPPENISPLLVASR